MWHVTSRAVRAVQPVKVMRKGALVELPKDSALFSQFENIVGHTVRGAR